MSENNTNKAAKTAKKIVKALTAFKVVKGLFNDPNWYQYHGNKAEIAYNSARPFDPVASLALRPIVPNQDNYPMPSPGVAVTHVIHNYVEFNDEVFNSDGFKMAIIETFRQIREQIKSNLPYTSQDVENYIKAVISLYAGAITIRRTLGWYSVMKSDIPELHAGMTMVTSNPSETGKVSAVPIHCVSDEQYASTVNDYMKLKNALSQLYIPDKITKYIDWWLGSVFIDQSNFNPQIYINMVRKLPLYGYDNVGNLTKIDNFNIATTDINVLIDQAISIATKQGIIIADLSKFTQFRAINLGDLAAYQPIAYEDREFFNVLINSYTVGTQQGTLKLMMNSEYIRADVLPDLTQDKAVGMAYGLAYAFGEIAPFRVVSQAMLLTNATDLRTMRNAVGSLAIPATSGTKASIYLDLVGDSEPYIFIQQNGLDDTQDTIIVNNTGEVVNSYVNADVNTKLDENTTINFTSVIMATKRDIDETVNSARPTYPICKGANGKYIVMTWNGTDDSDKIYYDCPGPYAIEGGKEVPYNRSQHFSFSTENHGGLIVYRMTWGGDTTHKMRLTITDGNALKAIQSAYTKGSVWYDDRIFDAAFFYYQSIASSISYRLYSESVIKYFIENVDYHIPIVSRRSTSLEFDATQSSVRIYDTFALLKECYVPVTISRAELSTAVYQMTLGLFSNSLTKKSNDNRADRNKNQKKDSKDAQEKGTPPRT